MKTIKKILCIFILWIFWLINISPVLAQNNPYDGVLEATTSTTKRDNTSLDVAIKWEDVITDDKWVSLFNEQILKIVSYVIDVFIVIWIAVAFFGWYNIMTSEKEETMKEWVRLVVFGIIWIIIMVSARFLATSLVWDGGIITTEFASASDTHTPNWIEFADNLYNNIMYPFIKIALYFVIWILFFVMAGKVVWFVTATDDKTKSKAAGIIIRCVVWILMVMWSKQIVEAVMWNQDKVLKKEIIWSDNTVVQQAPIRIDEQWNPILEFGSIPLIAQIINWIMGLTMLIVLILIIVQGYKILTKPDDPKTRESMKKAIIYILIWVLVIWASYVISNALVLNNIPIDLVSVPDQ